jgi:DNA-binding LacI/PurR family transcriptional regulator
VALPYYEIGRWAVHHLLDLIEEPPAERPVPAVQHRISGRYVRRQSL